MIHEDTEVLFPPRVIPALGNLRSSPWRQLVQRVKDLPRDHLDRLAFVLMMARLCGCATCQADAFRALRGCTQCAIQTVRRYRDTDQSLVDAFTAAQEEVRQYLQGKGKQHGTQ